MCACLNGAASQMLLECARNHFQQLSFSSLLYYDDVILNYLPMTTLSLQGIGALLVGFALIITMCCFACFGLGNHGLRRSLILPAFAFIGKPCVSALGAKAQS